MRRGNQAAFEVLVSRYQSRLLAFCRHLLGSREDAEDVLQEVMTAAFNAMIADERPINVRPWLYRIARNRCLNHLRRVQAVASDAMDLHLSEFGASTADKVHKAEEFRLLVDDIHGLPETQRTALVLREMDALSYEQIAEAMETTVPSVKSLLVRARLSLAEASEARLLSCEQVRIELAEVAEGILNRASSPVRRHLRTCQRCSTFQSELKRTSKALAALLPLGPLALAKQLILVHLGHSAGAGAGAGSGASGTGAAVGTGAAAGSGAAMSSGAAVGSSALAGGAFAGGGGLVPIGIGTIATKAAAGLAAAAIVTASAVEVTRSTHTQARPLVPVAAAPAVTPAVTPVRPVETHRARPAAHKAKHAAKKTKATTERVALTVANAKGTAGAKTHHHRDGTTETQTVATVLNPAGGGAGDQSASCPAQTGSQPTSSPPSSEPSSTPTTTTTTGSTTTTTGSTTTTTTSTSTTTTPTTTTTTTSPTTTTSSTTSAPPTTSSCGSTTPTASGSTSTTSNPTPTTSTTTTSSSTTTTTSQGTTTTGSGSGSGTTTTGSGAAGDTGSGTSTTGSDGSSGTGTDSGANPPPSGGVAP